MVDPRSSRFWQIAIRCGLIEPAKLEECWNTIPAEKRTPDAIDRRLARQAVNSGYLTLWQAQQVLSGRQQGLRIDRYVLLDQIGHGGMGRVYLARDTRLGRLVAVKILSKERVNNPRALARFKREAKVGAQLQHENLVRIYDEGEVQGMPYLVMEYITGQTVGQLIAEMGRIEPAMASELGRQIAMGLDHLHQKGLLHRDVNPSNILVDRGGTAKLTDLGLAIDLGDAEDVVTRDGATVGTFDYISPEQARNPRQIDTRSDIYSLGCTLYHMISGRVPFPAPSLPEKLFAHQSKVAEPLLGQVSGLPAGLDEVVRRMMGKTPEERYARPSLVARALEPFARPSHLGMDEPSTPRQRQGTPSSVVVGDSPARGGSDPDLAILPSDYPRPAAEASSDPFGFVKIDLGPGESLSESLSSARSRSQDHGIWKLRQRWPWFAGAGALLLVAMFLWANQGGKREPSRTAAAKPGPAKPADKVDTPPPVEGQFVVAYDDGTRLATPTLKEAVTRAARGQGRVILGDQRPVVIESTSARQLRIGTGKVTIEAAPGTRPLIEVTLNAAAPAIFAVNPTSSLTLRGLHFVIERKLADTNAVPSVIESAGNLRLDQCTLVVKGDSRRARGIFARGRVLHLSNSFLSGLQTPIEVVSYQDSEVRIEQCMLIGAPESSPGPVTGGGWATVYRVDTNRVNKPRRLIFDHCTAVGTGFVRFEGPLDKAALHVEISNCVVAAQALALWPEVAFPGAMKWDGESNLYGVTGDVLIASGTPSQNAPSLPKDLQSWSSTAAIRETKTQERIVRFIVQPNGAGTRPGDYKLIEVDPPLPGADPAQVASPGL